METLTICKIIAVVIILMLTPMLIAAHYKSEKKESKIGSFDLAKFSVIVFILTITYAVYSVISSMWSLYS
ncbi:hypothetical protein [Photobacterium damselae]|uniref:hypothetical protein n=1 Tax=Photobacterium damselae TaxID=38293 RepID=UPI004068D150